MIGRKTITLAALTVALTVALTWVPVAAAPAPPAAPPAAQPAVPAAEPGPLPAQAPVENVDVPVAFQVQNVNRSLNQCATDGQPYTVRGYLTGPAHLLNSPAPPPVTLYVHGTNTGQWIWRLPVEGFNYVQELADRGHVSVTIDRLGYGENAVPDGFGTCTGGNADIAHQVVDQLRAGTYQVEGRAPTPFGTVFMGGHSSGALVAELVAYSFGNIDGIVATGWAGIGITDETARRFFPMFDSCQNGLLGSAPPGPEADGYTYFDPTLADFYQAGVSDQADQRVRDAMRVHHVRSPCGVMLSEPIAIMEDLTHLGRIDVPVLLVYGAEDTLRQGVAPYAGLFTASPDVTETTIPGAGHIMLIDVNAPVVYDTVAEWLARRGG
jgi:pimeloyl-ACP methyl ester carboxylesterase